MAADAPAAFVSYSREDSEFVLRLAEDLKAAGANVWLDQLDVAPGQRWDRTVEDALQRCPRMLLILSPPSVNSDNVMDEVSFALEEGKTIIPILFKDCPIPFRLRRVQYIDFRTDYQRGLRELLRAVDTPGSKGQFELPSPTVPPPPPPATPEPKPAKSPQPKPAKSPNEVTESTVKQHEVWIVGSNRTILRSKDGGQTWSKQAAPAWYWLSPVGNLHSVTVPLATSAWAVGDSGIILHTTDGGVRWSARRVGAPVVQKVDFITSKMGWAVGWGLQEAVCAFTKDGGGSWTQQVVKTRHNLYGVSFVDSVFGWLCGDHGTILHTEDGGATWKKQDSKIAEDLRDILFQTTTSGWAVGAKETILHTDDFGESWVVQNGGMDTDQFLHSVDFSTPSSGWVVGDRGTVLHTDDAGWSWQSQNSGTTSNLYGVKFVTPLSGWIVGMSGTLLHTEDGGNHWQKWDAGTAEHLYAIAFAPSGKTSP
jgi:photosystem II stability/assembly factor-like uncharacterized protein